MRLRFTSIIFEIKLMLSTKISKAKLYSDKQHYIICVNFIELSMEQNTSKVKHSSIQKTKSLKENLSKPHG